MLDEHVGDNPLPVQLIATVLLQPRARVSASPGKEDEDRHSILAIVLREPERELDAATPRAALYAAHKAR